MGQRCLQMVLPPVWTRKWEDEKVWVCFEFDMLLQYQGGFHNRQAETFSSFSPQGSSTWKQTIYLCHYHFRAWNIEVAQYILDWWIYRLGRQLNEVNFWSKFLIYDDNSRSVSLCIVLEYIFTERLKWNRIFMIGGFYLVMFRNH